MTHRHDRSLPDGDGFDVYSPDMDYLGHRDTLDDARTLASQRPGAYLSRHDQFVADDGLLGCNDCGERLFWCEDDGAYFHVDPEQECFLSGGGHDG